MLKIFSLISDIDKANLTKELQCLLPPQTNNAPDYLVNYEGFFLNKLPVQSCFVYILQFIMHGWPFISLFLCNTD